MCTTYYETTKLVIVLNVSYITTTSTKVKSSGKKKVSIGRRSFQENGLIKARSLAKGIQEPALGEAIVSCAQCRFYINYQQLRQKSNQVASEKDEELEDCVEERGEIIRNNTFEGTSC
ncbi:1916_t:CDS:2 [Entrophospora sp. SA101]|nr:1916_t:CDS:2 [Entrophospora sp. SA101]